MTSLFEQLGSGMSLSSELPSRPVEVDTEKISQMQFTRSLLQHLDQVYGKMIAKEMFQEQHVDEYEVVEITGTPRHSYYSPGHSAVTESA
tara:strand:+ start:3290 stop:3559 length:270 start_codon:yes stop_codon:yes gene_type:complete